MSQQDGEKSIFLDLSPKVGSVKAEHGLFDLVFHPNFAENGYFFVTYTTPPKGISAGTLMHSRFQVTTNPNVADGASEKSLLRIDQAIGVHNGGGMAINPKGGLLYLCVGDDAQNLLAQDTKSVKGKIVRLDVDSIDQNIKDEGRQYLDAVVQVETEIV